MKTDVAILHHDYPADLRDKVDERLQGLVKFYDRVITLRARLERQGEDHRVEIVANAGRGAVLVADVLGESLGEAMDEAFDRMRGQLTRHRDKVKLGNHRSAS